MNPENLPAHTVGWVCSLRVNTARCHPASELGCDGRQGLLTDTHVHLRRRGPAGIRDGWGALVRLRGLTSVGQMAWAPLPPAQSPPPPRNLPPQHLSGGLPALQPVDGGRHRLDADVLGRIQDDLELPGGVQANEERQVAPELLSIVQQQEACEWWCWVGVVSAGKGVKRGGVNLRALFMVGD